VLGPLTQRLGLDDAINFRSGIELSVRSQADDVAQFGQRSLSFAVARQAPTLLQVTLARQAHGPLARLPCQAGIDSHGHWEPFLRPRHLAASG
jgi:hypothetical protein